MSTLTQARLKELLYYNELTGIFTWRIHRNNKARIGDWAGTIKSNGYIAIVIDYKNYYAHRLAFLYVVGYFPVNDVDHINGLRSNNTWSNLRQCSRADNIANSTKATTDSIGIKGICFYNENGGRYKAAVMKEGKTHLKYFMVSHYAKGQAIVAAENWLKETRANLHKEFTNHG